ncbi:hypothetical protein L198_04516 [Cryptococcus wingfieldii CBS 7118]|uniref:Methyltransferase n=1 Tax=Cryptococcus wingfieldii CBS 7118 TaxID=1295528 RepID=A0A1E3J4X9_9TREE|nr:hypothetical protein L198_04516 [Cryptococcus wingfieldii CBS 7118]ODN95897.1 hypothetical protein L198_04516 [Cryptococcus wingfieldii CBS 7118]
MSSKTGTDFWSPTYWSTRFTTETNFEWLVPACTLVPIVKDVVRELPAPPRIWNYFENGVEDGEEGFCGVGGEGGEGGEEVGGEEEEGEGEGEEEEEVVNILHLGSGTSILGTQLQTYLSSPSPYSSPPSPPPSPPSPFPSPSPPPPKTQASSIPKCQVYDADYVPLPSSTAQEEGRVPFLLVDALDLGSLYASLPLSKGRGVVGGGGWAGGEKGEGGGRSGKGGGRGRGRGKRKWDMVLDKSTIDAISTGPLLPPPPSPSSSPSSQKAPSAELGEGEEELPADPAERTLLNVGRVVRKGGRWVSVSYSSTRYDFLPFCPSPSPSSPATSSAPTSLPKSNDKEKYGWRVIRKEIVAMTSLPEGRLVRDGRGERVVYEPETGIWLYVLERV